MIFFKLKLHLLMMSCWVVCALFARRLGYTYTELEVGAYELIQRAMGAVIILMCVGALIGAWISAGTVPGDDLCRPPNHFPQPVSRDKPYPVFGDVTYDRDFMGYDRNGRPCHHGDWRRPRL